MLAGGTCTLAYTPQPGAEQGPYAATRMATKATAGLPWAPATDGLRNITRVNRYGTAAV